MQPIDTPTSTAVPRRRLLLAGTSRMLLEVVERTLTAAGHSIVQAETTSQASGGEPAPIDAIVFITNQLDEDTVAQFGHLVADRQCPALCILPTPGPERIALLERLPADELMFAFWRPEEILLRVQRLFRRQPATTPAWAARTQQQTTETDRATRPQRVRPPTRRSARIGRYVALDTDRADASARGRARSAQAPPTSRP